MLTSFWTCVLFWLQEAREAMSKAQHARDAAVEAVDKAEFQIEVDAYEAILKSVETK